MIHDDFVEVLNLVINDKFIRGSAIAVTIIIFSIGFFYSILVALFLYLSYILGYAVCWVLIRYQSRASTCLQKLTNFYRDRISFRRKLKQSCSVCDDLTCKRHQQTKGVTPWKYLFVDKELDVALEEYFNKIIQTFVVSWYEKFTEDNDFLYQLRFCLRYASALVVNRILEVDCAAIISNKLMPCAIRHIDNYLYIQQIAKLKNIHFNNVVVEYLGAQLHAAAANRRNEINYLQHLVSALLSQILPETFINCRNYNVLIREVIAGWVLLPLMDAIADPGIINSLVILATTYKSNKSTRNDFQMESVEFLQNFMKNDNTKKSLFSMDLNSVKQDTELFYAFMQFLKRQEHVHLLQFCLDVDEFYINLLKPDLSKKELEELHREAIKLYKEYLNKNSLNFIGCSNKIAEDFHDLIEDGIDGIARLRTPESLNLAYEHAFSIMESVWLPQFFRDNEFYSHLCGSKVTASYNKAAKNRMRLINFGSPIRVRGRKYYENNPGTVSKISSGFGKIRGALKASQTIEGALYAPENPSMESDIVEDIILGECDSLFRDLSTWRVEITHSQASPANKVVNFCIKVTRLDVISEEAQASWVVLRKDQDFYTLKAKLVEFHGENEICDSPLPSRKAGSSLDTRQVKYEDFLKKLLQKPALRGSDLLYTFLTTEEDFTLFIATTTPVIQDFGNIYQSVAYKLRKEKGQYLDSFMASFLNSTGKSKAGKFEGAEVGDEPELVNTSHNKSPHIPKTNRSSVFNDNFSVPYSSLKKTSSSSVYPVDFADCLFYLLKNIFRVPNGILRMYVAICSIAQHMLDMVCRLFIEKKLRALLCQPNLTILVKQLEDITFHPRISPSEEELEERKIRAFKELKSSMPVFLNKVCGINISSGALKLLEILQNPQYNKQLAYNLLDIILVELFPAVGKE